MSYKIYNGSGVIFGDLNGCFAQQTAYEMSIQMSQNLNKSASGDLQRIYVADDDTYIREALKTFLENAGYVVQAFENGDALLSAFEASPSDLVILDVMMPGTNGFAVCKALRQISHVPIFLVTARDSDLDYQTGLDIGADDFFTKPVSPMTITMKAKAIFRRVQYERAAAKAELTCEAHEAS